MLFLFLHFYYTTYVASKSRRAQKKVAAEAATAASPVAGEGTPSETKSSYINGYVADGHSVYSLRPRKNGSINGNASTVADGSLWLGL